MIKFIFTGRIHPERSWVTIPRRTYPISLSDGTSPHITVFSGKGQILVEVETSHSPEFIDDLYLIVGQVMKSQVDALGYRKGIGWDVEITGGMCINDHGTMQIYGPSVKEVENKESERSLDDATVGALAIRHAALRNALADLREAIRSLEDTSFFCFRTLERIRIHVQPNYPKEKNHALREAEDKLRLDHSCHTFLYKQAKHERHGKWGALTGKERAKAVCLIWKIVDRFIIFLDRNQEKLDEEGFPILKSNDVSLNSSP